MLTSHQIQTINDIVDGVEKDDEVEQLALSDRKRRRAESIADAAHTVLHILRDHMADADRAAYDSLYAELNASALDPGATRHLDAATAMWRWAVVSPLSLGPSQSLTRYLEPVQSPVHPTSQAMALDTTVVASDATTASTAHLHGCIPDMESLAMGSKIRTCMELDACAIMVSCGCPLLQLSLFGNLTCDRSAQA